MDSTGVVVIEGTAEERLGFKGSQWFRDLEELLTVPPETAQPYSWVAWGELGEHELKKLHLPPDLYLFQHPIYATHGTPVRFGAPKPVAIVRLRQYQGIPRDAYHSGRNWRTDELHRLRISIHRRQAAAVEEMNGILGYNKEPETREIPPTAGELAKNALANMGRVLTFRKPKSLEPTIEVVPGPQHSDETIIRVQQRFVKGLRAELNQDGTYAEVRRLVDPYWVEDPRLHVVWAQARDFQGAPWGPHIDVYFGDIDTARAFLLDRNYNPVKVNGFANGHAGAMANLSGGYQPAIRGTPPNGHPLPSAPPRYVQRRA